MLRCLRIGLLSVVLIALAATARGELKVGDDAPEFELRGSDGKTYRLSDFRDQQAVIVAWYPKAFTGGCTKECQSLKEHGEKLRKFSVAVFAASCDPVEKNTQFAKSLEVDYPILSDPDGAIATQYGIYNAAAKIARRVTFIIGADGKILQIVDQVKTASHGADLAEQLRALQVPERK